MAKSGSAEKKAALIAASITSFLTPFMGSSINVALPTIGEAFKSNTIVINWIATSYLLGAAVFLIPFGRAADIVGRKKNFLMGTIVFTVASFLCGLAGSAGMLIAFRVIQAIGGSMIFGTAIAILTSVFPSRERGKVLGITVSFVYTGLAIGPFAGGLLTEHLGWRSVFFSVVPLGIVAIYFVIRKLQGEWAEAQGEKFDWKGSVLYGSSLILIMYGFPKLSTFHGFLYLMAGVLIMIYFIIWQLKIDNPLLDLKLFKNNITFRYSNLAALINYSATFAITFLLSFYLQKIRQLTPQETGIILVSSPVIMALISPSVGKLSDRVEPRILSSLGMAISTLGLLFLIFLTPDTKILSLVLILAFLGIGFALFSSPNTNAVMGSVKKKQLGIASGSLGTMRLTGQMLSMGIVTMLFALFIGKVEINPSNLDKLLLSIRISFAVFSVMCFTGVFASLARGNVHS